VIVRVLEHGQYRLDDGDIGKLNALDNAVASAVAADNAEDFFDSFSALIEFVTTTGERVEDTELVTSDHVLPYPGTTLEEAREAFAGEGAIPG
jgi:hypothetical protein